MNIPFEKATLVDIPEGVPTFEWSDYECVEDLGYGGGGESYKVVNVSSGHFFTIKKIDVLAGEVNDEDHLDRIQKDMRLATSLNHINLNKCLGVCCNQYGIHFLYNWIPYNFIKTKILDESYLAHIAYQLLNGLNYLHKEKNFVFKHLTPGNILLDYTSSDALIVKIADVLTVKDKFIIGSVPFCTEYAMYIAPENYLTYKDVDDETLYDLDHEYYSKSDVWSLGLCLLQLYTGAYPFVDDKNGKLSEYIISGYAYEIDSQSEELVLCNDVWPPRPPTGTPPLLSDFISSCLNLDVSERPNVDQLLNHHFITSYCSPVEYQHQTKKLRLSAETTPGTVLVIGHGRQRD